MWRSVSQAAEDLGVNDSRVRQLLRAGDLRGQKLGSQWVIHVDEIERFKRLDRPAGNPNFRQREKVA